MDICRSFSQTWKLGNVDLQNVTKIIWQVSSIAGKACLCLALVRDKTTTDPADSNTMFWIEILKPTYEWVSFLFSNLNKSREITSLLKDIVFICKSGMYCSKIPIRFLCRTIEIVLEWPQWKLGPRHGNLQGIAIAAFLNVANTCICACIAESELTCLLGVLARRKFGKVTSFLDHLPE